MNNTSVQKSHHKNYNFFFNRSLVQFLLQIEITILIFSMPTCPKASGHKGTFIKEYAR